MKEIRGKHKKKYSSLPKANESQIAKNLTDISLV